MQLTVLFNLLFKPALLSPAHYKCRRSQEETRPGKAISACVIKKYQRYSNKLLLIVCSHPQIRAPLVQIIISQKLKSTVATHKVDRAYDPGMLREFQISREFEHSKKYQSTKAHEPGEISHEEIHRRGSYI